MSIIPTILLQLFLQRELTHDGGDEVGQRVGGNVAHGEEVGQKEAGAHGEEGVREDGREEEVGKVEDHDDHAQEADSAVLDAHDVHLVRNDAHEVHNDGLGHPYQTCVRDGMRHFPRHSSSKSHCGGAASDPGKRDLGLKGKRKYSSELRVVIYILLSPSAYFLLPSSTNSNAISVPL